MNFPAPATRRLTAVIAHGMTGKQVFLTGAFATLAFLCPYSNGQIVDANDSAGPSRISDTSASPRLPNDNAAVDLHPRLCRDHALQTYALPSVVASLGGFALLSVPDSTLNEIGSVVFLAQGLPLFWLNTPAAIGYTAAEILAYFTSQNLYAKNSAPEYQALDQSLLQNLLFSSVYEIYRESRTIDCQRRGLGADRSWRGYSLDQLLSAQVRPATFWRWTNAIPGLVAAAGVYNLISTSLADNYVALGYDTLTPGVGIAARLGYNLVLSTVVAVGEESLYRGVIYEEIKRSQGGMLAKVVDCLLFPAVHIPQEQAAHYSSAQINQDFLSRGALTLLLDFAYDYGGLPASISCHLLWNFGLFCYSGLPDYMTQPQGRISSKQVAQFPVGFSYTFAF